MTPRQKKVTEIELDRLVDDPEFKAHWREKEEKRLLKREEFLRDLAQRLSPEKSKQWGLRRVELSRDLAPVEQALRDIGYEIVDSITELKESGTVYKKAIPVLLDWLPRVTTVGAKDIIVHALGAPWAKPRVAHALIEEFLRVPGDPPCAYKWAIGDMLEIIGDEDVYDDMVTILRDRSHGHSRERFAMALGKMKNPNAVDVLIEMLDDEQIVGPAIVGLKRLKAVKARPFLERFLTHEKTWCRKAASSAIKAIDKKIEREKQKGIME
ncbi:TPA: hypothetical protein DDW35_01755 [Candidatus Sumerlaeota bacterium]|jgi:hypothetical protein|nr:hypothetical protein [Candidatus Sumerlaeota bacterium]